MLKLDSSLSPKQVKGKKYRSASFYTMRTLSIVFWIFAISLTILKYQGQLEDMPPFVYYLLPLILTAFCLLQLRPVCILDEDLLYLFRAKVVRGKARADSKRIADVYHCSLSYGDIKRMEYVPQKSKSEPAYIMIFTKQYTLFTDAPRSIIKKIEEKQRFYLPRADEEEAIPEPKGLWDELLDVYDEGTFESLWGEGVSVNLCDYDIKEEIILLDVSRGEDPVWFSIDKEQLTVGTLSEEEERTVKLSEFADRAAVLTYMQDYVNTLPACTEASTDSAKKPSLKFRILTKAIPILLFVLMVGIPIASNIADTVRERAEREAAYEELVGEYLAARYEDYRIVDYLPLERNEERFDVIVVVETNGKIDVLSHCLINGVETVELRLADLTPEQGEVACTLLDDSPATMALYCSRNEIPESVTVKRRIKYQGETEYFCITYE